MGGTGVLSSSLEVHGCILAFWLARSTIFPGLCSACRRNPGSPAAAQASPPFAMPRRARSGWRFGPSRRFCHQSRPRASAVNCVRKWSCAGGARLPKRPNGHAWAAQGFPNVQMVMRGRRKAFQTFGWSCAGGARPSERPNGRARAAQGFPDVRMVVRGRRKAFRTFRWP